MNGAKLENFQQAFRSNCGGSQRQCHCGLIFYNPTGGWDWQEGELEKLERDKTATAVDWTVSVIEFEGKEYALDCTCWHKRADIIVGFIDSHAQSIADYLTLEKKRKWLVAKTSAIVQEPT